MMVEIDFAFKIKTEKTMKKKKKKFYYYFYLNENKQKGVYKLLATKLDFCKGNFLMKSQIS